MLMIPKYYISIPDLLLMQVSFFQLPGLKPNLFFLGYLSILVKSNSILSVSQAKNLRIIFDSWNLSLIPHSKWQQILLTLPSVYITSHHLPNHLI